MNTELVFAGSPRDCQFNWCGFFESSQPWKHAERVNSDYELMIGIEGSMHLATDQSKFSLAPGELLILPPNTFFYGDHVSPKLRFYWLHFSVNGLKQFSLYQNIARKSDQWRLPSFSSELILDNEIVLLQQMQLLKQQDYPDHTLLNVYTFALLQGISDKFFRLNQQHANQQHYLVDYIKDYVQKNFKHSLDNEMLANYFGYNKAYLSHLFSKEAGLTISQYVTSVRLEAARQQLLTSTDSLKVIANENGFIDEKYFSRMFSRRYQVSPRDYRSKYGLIKKM